MTEKRRILPADLGRTVRPVTIAWAGKNKFDEVRLRFVETGPEIFFQPNDTGVSTLRQFIGDPSAAWVGRPIVLAVQRVQNPATCAVGDVVTVATPRAWYDVLGLALPALADLPPE
jgi:hypothetical protein